MTSTPPTIDVKTLSRILRIGRINKSKSDILKLGDLGDDMLYEIVGIIYSDITKNIYKEDLSYIELVELIYRHFENFEILIPYLQSIDKYSIGIPNPEKSQIKYPDDDCVRASIFTFGTYIMLKRYGGIFSQLVQFLYFYVQYLKVNRIRLEGREHIISEKVHKYLLQYHPIETNYTNIELHTSYEGYIKKGVVDTLISHINENNTKRPSFFISSFQKKDIAGERKIKSSFKNYVLRTQQIVEEIKGALTEYNNRKHTRATEATGATGATREPSISFSGYPVLIYIKKNNMAFTKGDKTDYVFPPYIPLKQISSIKHLSSLTQLTYSPIDEDGEILDYDTIYGDMYKKYLEEHRHLFHQTGGKKLKKKNILGTEKCIYKKQGDRREYIRHNGKLITIKEYRNIKEGK
jgi:hypothetical protein